MQTKNNDHNQSANRVRRGRVKVIGLGLDDAEGHIRYTRGDAFELIGGSEKAHSEMQKRALRIKAEIERLGITLERMSYEEYELIRAIIDRENEAAAGL